MSSDVIKWAIKACEKREAFRPRQELAQLLRDNNIGTWKGDRVTLLPLARERLWDLLEQVHGVPRGTSSEAWEGLSRVEALDLSVNEKVTGKAVRSDRIAVKAMPGQVLRLGGEVYRLPDGASLDIKAAMMSQLSGHDTLIFVENWEAFANFHQLNFEIPEHLRNAVLLYRGDVAAYPTAAAHEALREASQPVWVFSDLDPSGLLIALKAPRRAGLLWPAPKALASLFASGRGERGRYLDQLTQAQNTLENRPDPEIDSYWQVIKAAGLALPQEEFLRL